jgi:hypothetical protein
MCACAKLEPVGNNIIAVATTNSSLSRLSQPIDVISWRQGPPDANEGLLSAGRWDKEGESFSLKKGTLRINRSIIRTGET